MLIVNYGEEILETPTQKVTEFNEDLVTFTEEMISTMKESNGVGLAAPQVGDSRRICIAVWASSYSNNLEFGAEFTSFYRFIA